jgi:hypothetical protein
MRIPLETVFMTKYRPATPAFANQTLAPSRHLPGIDFAAWQPHTDL